MFLCLWLCFCVCSCLWMCSCVIMWCHVMSCDAVSCDVTVWHAVFVRGLYVAMEQYSSLCGCEAVLTLGVVDMEEGVPGRDQVECGRQEINDGEKQVREKDQRQPTNAQTHIMDDMRMEWNAHYRHFLRLGSCWAMQLICTQTWRAKCMRKMTCEVFQSTPPVGYSGSPSTKPTVTKRILMNSKNSYELISNSCSTTMCLKRRCQKLNGSGEIGSSTYSPDSWCRQFKIETAARKSDRSFIGPFYCKWNQL